MKKNTLKIKAFLTLVFLFISLFGMAQSQTFTTPGANTFTVPAGVTQVTVEVWGGGGRGGARTAGNNVALAGGGGGAYAKTTSITVTSGATYNLNVGAGSTSTTAGGDSWFINNTTILAKGGNSVADDSNTSGAGGLALNSFGATTLNGGNGGTGTGGSFGGGGGSSAGTSSVGNYTNTTTNNQTGATAPAGGANGGKGAQSGTAGIDGAFPGGGGGGGYRAFWPTQVPGNGANGQVIISWTVAPCVTPPTTANAGTDQTLVACATTTTLAGNTPSIGTGMWSVVSGTATITTPSSATSGVTGLIVGATATLRWTTTNGGCTPSTDDVVITTLIGPLCMIYCTPTFTDGVRPTTNVTFSGINNTTSATIGGPALQSFTDTATVIQGSTTNVISIKGNTNGNYTYNFRVYIDWDQNGTYGNNTNEIYDIGTITNSNGSDAKVLTGNISVPATALIGNTRMRVMKRLNGYSTGPCQTGAGYGETEDYIVNIVSLGPPTITSFGATNGCAGDSITINGTNLIGATTVTIGGTAVNSITSNSGTVLVAVIGSGTTGTVSVTTPIDTATSADTFTINPSPIATAGSPLTTICQGGTTVALEGTYGGSATSAIWSSNVPGGNFTNNGGATPNTTTWTPPAAYTGTATLTLTTSGGSCTAATATKTQLVNAPTASAGSPLATICQGSTTVALGGSYGGSATSAIWSSSVPGGTFTNNTGSTPNTATWTPPAAYTGTATLTLTTSGGSCGTTTASKTQVVTTGSFATVGSAMTITGSLTSTSLGGNTPSPGSGAWTKISGPASATANFSSNTTGSSSVTVSELGSYVFRWTVTSSCGITSADIAVTFKNYKTPDYTLFYEDFDATDGGWTSTTSTGGSWTRTTSFPATFPGGTIGGVGITEFGENSFFRISNFDDYQNNSNISITSPSYNFTGYENLLFNIDVRYFTEKNNDGMRIMYSVDGGGTYALLTETATLSNNWYNTATVAALGTAGWSDNNIDIDTDTGLPLVLTFTPANRFEKASVSLSNAIFSGKTDVRFRVEFKSNGSTTSNGVAFDNVSVQGDALTVLTDSPIGPANIKQNLSLWFKTNAGIAVTDGTALTTWEDQAYDTTRTDLVNKESAKAIASNAPTFRDNAARNINFNPVVDFDATNKDYMNGKGGLYSQDYFVVVYSENTVANTMTTTRQIPLGGKTADSAFHEEPTGLGLGATTGRFNNEVISHSIGTYNGPATGTPAPGIDSYGRAFTSTTQTFSEPMLINVKTNATATESEIYKNGIKIDNTTGRTGALGDKVLLTFYDYKNLPFYIGTGRSGISGRASSSINGRITEIISYTAPNDALKQQKIQSYLGLKYGLTLHATTGSLANTRLNDVNYIDSAGNIIWNTTANTGFNYDITGIGRDDDSQLYQKQSKSVNPHTSTAYDDDITIGLTTIATTNNLNTNTCNDKNFLVWGNNNGTLAAQSPVEVNISSGITPALTSNVEFVSIGRTWKVVKTVKTVESDPNNIHLVKVSIPKTMLTNTITPPGDFLMFISNTPTFDPTAEYRIMTENGSNLETTYDFVGTKYITFGYAPEKIFVRSIAFDGSKDYLDAGKVLNLNTSFTVSAWIKRNSLNQTILSKRDNPFTTGYDLSINNDGYAEMSWMNGSKQAITSSVVIPSGIWHNIAVTYDGTTAKLYVDGVLDASKPLITVPANTQSFLVAAADGVTPTSFFNGNIDEVRVWSVALKDKELRYVMNQEILSNGLATNGSIVPNTITLNDISSIPWSNLSAYYPMSTYTYTNAKDVSINHHTAALRNLTTVDRQTAPLPYESATHGAWSTGTTWLNNTVQDLPNSLSIVDGTTPVNWNIVKTSHDITSTGHKTVLGLMVESNKITASSDSKIEVSNYLKLDGKIDLVGMSQLVQTLDCDLDVTSKGSIERDQQGQLNKYNYNYWSSPVSPITLNAPFANNNDYTVTGIMKDGTTAIPQNITWIGGYDGAASTPISIARYWLYTFDNKVNAYANWNKITESSLIRVGLGFTMKGSGTTGTQNYTFVGKPNNGLIDTNTVGKDQLLLTGNPYPSALDAKKFIEDNAGSIDGNLYFWEHYSTNNTHVLKDYQGGYATLNLVGGVPSGSIPTSVDVDYISGLGSPSKGAPKQYIPVGQGFFVNGSDTGGTIVINNNQRYFARESDSNSNILYKTRSKTSKTAQIDHWNDNSNDIIQKDNYKRIRLGFNANNNYHRQVLLGFMNEKATSGIDYGYDGIGLDELPNDMYFLNGENQLVIQGEGYFNENASFPIGVKTDVAGKVSFTIDAIENFDGQQNVYIYDDETKTYNEIQKNAFEVNMPAGENNTRFSLRFKDKSSTTDKIILGLEENNINNDIKIAHIQNSNTLKIINNSVETSVEKVTLFNINGQSIANWKIENQDQQNIQIPINAISSGVYVAKLKTTTGELSKKIIIK